MTEEPKHESTPEEEWPEPLSRAERDALDEATWNSNAIKVWPLGPDGPAMTLSEVAAWRAEQERMAASLSDTNEDAAKDG